MTLFQEKYNAAPKKIQEVTASEETSTTLADIAVAHQVDEEGFGNPIIGRLVGQVLVGMLHPKDFVPSLEKELSVPKETAQKIAKEVNEKIFSQVKDELVKLHNLQQPSSTPQTPSPTQNNDEKPYSTPPELFEKKLKQNVVVTTTTPQDSDSYREPIDG